MEWRHVEWEERRLRLPGALLKGRKMLVLPLPQIVVDHLEPIRREDGPDFDWPHTEEFFRRCFHQLQAKAGVAQFGLHSLRRTAITKLWAKSPAAAQLLAGHCSPIITRMHYVNVQEVLADAMRD
jgi:integrase